ISRSQIVPIIKNFLNYFLKNITIFLFKKNLTKSINKKMLAPEGKDYKIFGLCFCVAVCSNFMEGYSNSYPNTAIATFKNYINNSYVDRGNPDGLSEIAYSWIWSSILNVWFIGYLIGTFVTPYFTDNYGRRTTLMYANFASFIGTIISTGAVSLPIPELLFFARLIASISSGTSFGALILWIQESTPTHMRGVTSFLSETSFIFMTVVGMGFGLDDVFGNNLIVLIGIGAIPAFLGFILMIPLKETPKFLLINKNSKVKCSESLSFYFGNKYDHIDTMNLIMKESDEVETKKVIPLIKEVFKTPNLLKAYIIGVLALQIIVGIWPIIYLSTDFFSVHFDNLTAQYYSFGLTLACFFANLPGLLIIDRFGRRPLFLITAVINIISLIIYIISDRLSLNGYSYMKYGCVGSLFTFGISYGIALGPIAYFITSEMVPQRSRAVVQSMVFSTNTILNCIFSEITYPLYKLIEVYCFIPLFIIPSIFAAIYLSKNLPETRGKEIYQIVNEMIRNSQSYGSTNTINIVSDVSINLKQKNYNSNAISQNV
uniref:MFS domain-containing protein n=3 Tax=Strongyloides stercoralis TaxID=6248 RepID=A0AAF5DNQ2_STRER